MDWSIIRSGSPLVRTPPQSIPMGDTLTSLGIEGGHKTDPITPQPSHPIPKQIHRGVVDDAIQGVLPTAPTAH